jgi:hypothetical protein
MNRRPEFCATFAAGSAASERTSTDAQSVAQLVNATLRVAGVFDHWRPMRQRRPKPLAPSEPLRVLRAPDKLSHDGNDVQGWYNARNSTASVASLSA